MTTTDTQPASAPLLYTLQRLFFMALDPVHIGTGGYRLGRVDMTIAREPGTNVPKIPGTSLAGAARSYAAMYYGKPDAAGQHKKVRGDKKACPIIYTFGTAMDTSSAGGSTEGSNQAGTVSISDAHILFFPVNSMVGPVWVSTVDRVREAWDNSVTLPQNAQPTDDKVVTSLDWNRELNLGWLLFTSTKGLTITPPADVAARAEWTAIAERIVLVTPKLFSQIVNSNLEVRTSVSIDPETGAAAQRALFTYEAIPRTTWLWSDVIEDDYRKNNGSYPFPINQQFNSQTNIENEGAKLPDKEQWDRPLDVVNAGMRLIEHLGIGGMGTRGFGRMRLVAPRKASNGGAQ
jgi:CRISPR-associated protein Cmr4